MAAVTMRGVPPLIVIAGPTASGKTGLAIRLAKEFNGEIISADSRAIYKNMDIGTAKPSVGERQGVPHWGIDLVNPDESFSAADFKTYALEKMQDIRMRDKIPILVGGTGLYVDSIIYDYQFPDLSAESGVKQVLSELEVKELIRYCDNNNIKLPENKYNKRHLINSILRNNRLPQRRKTIIDNTYVVIIATDRDVLRDRIAARAEQLFDSGVINEANMLADAYGWDSEAMTGNIYPIIRRLSMGEIDLTKAKELFRYSDWQLAKRQLTWLRRNNDAMWLDLDQAYTYLRQILAAGRAS